MTMTDDQAERGREIKAQLARLEDEYGPIPVPMVRHADGCDGVDCACEDECRARRFTSWVDTLARFEPAAVKTAVSALLATWKRYGRPWPDLEDLTSRIPRTPEDPHVRALWERVQRAALYGEVDGLDGQALAAIGGPRALPRIAARLESGRTDNGAAHAEAYRIFTRRLATLPALAPAEVPKMLPVPEIVSGLVAAADRAGDPGSRPRQSRATRVLAPVDVREPTDRPAGWADEQRRRLAELERQRTAEGGER